MTENNFFVDEIRERLNIAKDFKDLKQADILDLMNKISKKEDVAQTTLSLVLAGKTKKIDAVFCRLYAQALDVSLVWLLTGTGSVAMPFEGIKTTQSPHIVSAANNAMTNLYTRIPVYSVHEENNKMIFNQDETEPALLFRSCALPPHGDFHALRVRDNSLSPELAFNDIAVINVENKEPVEGGTFAIWLNNRMFIRKLVIPYDGYLLVGEHPNTTPIQVSQQDITEGNFKIIGRVVLRAGKVF